jgi:hypothetical protein
LGFFTEFSTECFGDCFFRGRWELLPLVLGLAAFVVVFEVMLGCPFLDSRPQDAGAGVVRREIARFVVNRLAPADFRSVAYLGPPYQALAFSAD